VAARQEPVVKSPPGLSGRKLKRLLKKPFWTLEEGNLR